MNRYDSNSNNSNNSKSINGDDNKNLSNACDSGTESNHANKPKLQKMISIEHVTPKVWSNQPHRTSEKNQWRPVRPSYLKNTESGKAKDHAKTDVKDDAPLLSSSSSNRLQHEITNSKSEPRCQRNKAQHQDNDKTSNHCGAETKKNVSKSSSTFSERLHPVKTNSNHKPEARFRKNRPKDITTTHVQNPRMPYRTSFSRDTKSPGFGTIRRMWDAKANQTEAEAANTSKQSMPNTWHNTRKSYEKKRTESSLDILATNIDILSPKPFRSGSTNEAKTRYSFKNVVATSSDQRKDYSHETIATLQTNEKAASDNSESDLSEEEDKSDSESEKSLSLNSSFDHSEDTHVNNVRSAILNDINDRLDSIDVGVYGSIDENESETEIDAIVYNSAESDNDITSYTVTNSEFDQGKVASASTSHDVSSAQVVAPPNDYPQPEYLPMASHLVDSNERRYVDMTVKSTAVAEVEYDTFHVPPPSQNQSKSKREYHEIDPDVPPLPRHDPPKLPLDKKPTLDSSEPLPPLPPANTTGRRSKVYSNKHEILKNLHNTSPSQQKSKNKSAKKLKYVEVQVGPPSTASPSRQKKTNYTDVLIVSDNERLKGERSGSGTSEEGLAAKKQSITKPILPSFFSKKEPKSNKTKDAQEQPTDFEKERNKKKRISGRFLKKKTKDAIKTKKEVQNRSSHNSECEADSSLNLESSSTITSEALTNRLSGKVPSNSSTTTSPSTSGDGEVGRLPARDVTTTTEYKLAWKVLPTTNNAADANESYKPTPQPRTTSMNQRLKTKSFSPTGRESTFLAYPTALTPRSSDAKDNSDDKPRVVSSFLHGAAKKTNSDTNLSAGRSGQPPPVPRHRHTSLTPMDTGLDGLSSAQDQNRPAAPIPLPGLASASSEVTSRVMTSSKKQERKSFYQAADDPTLVPEVGIYDAAEEVSIVPEIDAPPPLPARDDDDDTIYETIVPPSPLINEEHGYKFLEDEPLYQIYRTRTLTHASSKRKAAENSRDKSKSEPVKSPGFESGLLSDDLGTSTLWRSIPEVVQSGLANNMQPEELKLQQSQFEVITSQASYLRSLNILIQHFLHDWAMQTTDVLPQSDKHHLFSNIETVRKIEQKFLRDLEAHFWQDIKLTSVCDLVAQYAKSDFDVYIRYIQNQVYQDRALTKLQRTHDRFAEELCRLETSPACNKLPLLSFLMLPMQRVTRLPLLVTAIVNAADSAGDMEMCKKAKHTLGVVNKLVKKCNDSARSMQQTEQLAEIASQLDYSSSVKMYALVSQSRSLVKKGEMNISMITDSKKAAKTSKLWLFLFSDVLFIAKKKNLMDFGPTRYEVTDWANRQYLAVNESAVTENAIFLVILENQAGKRVEMTLMPMAQNELKRWENALNPPKYGSLGESIYESWDCPQYSCVEPYEAQQPDELSLDVGDVMQIFKKTADGWVEGERLRDGECGWFPKSFCEEIEDEHVRSRNMKNLYRTYAAA